MVQDDDATNDRSTAPQAFRTITTILGMVFLIAAAFTIVRAVQRNDAPRRLAPVTVARDAAPRTPKPLNTARPTAPAATPAAAPAARIVQASTAQPRASAAPAKSISPTSLPSATATRVQVAAAERPRPAAHQPQPTVAPRVAAEPSPAASVDESCATALRYERAATNDAAGRLAVYNATVAGLAANSSCTDVPSHVVNEAYLLSLRAPAEGQLRIGNWKADLQRADERLRECIALPVLRGTAVADDCRTQLGINAGVRQELSALAVPAAR